MNILVYNDLGASPNSVKHTIDTLKALLGHAYDIIPIDRTVLQSEPWETGCVMLVMPGGRDLPYCQALNGSPNARIRSYVENGGRYLGLCAGAYYGSQQIEFEKDNPMMEIIQSRELAFYPGTSRGTTYPGFIYNSETGARSVTVILDQDFQKDLPEEIQMYYNGGGYFVEPEKYENVTVLGRYKEPSKLCLEVQCPAAVVHCQVKKGHAILIGTHPEYDISSQDLLLTDENVSPTLKTIINNLILSEKDRKLFMRAIFARIGLNVLPIQSDHTVQENTVPDVTPLYFAGLTKEWVQKPVSHLLRISDPITHLLNDKHDIFHISAMGEPESEQAHLLNLCRLKQNEPPLIHLNYQRTMDTNTKSIYPPHSSTSYFNMEDYFQHLVQKRSLEWGGGAWLKFGSGILYAQVISSTQSLMDKNFKFSQALPTGFVAVASHQIAGRGRGRNAWVSQSGALQFSLLLRHPLKLRHASVVFIQYIIALAVVQSIRERPGYENVPLRLKWPNDIYAETEDGLNKVGGLLINSTFVDAEFVLVIGCGINLSNSEPTVSINDVIQATLPSLRRLSPEDVLAGILVKFEMYYNEFCEKGMGPWFLTKYYERWLHSNAVVTLTTHNNESVKIIGITSDFGMLKVESLDRRDKSYGLLPDGNSFDMLKGLLVQKK